MLRCASVVFFTAFITAILGCSDPKNEIRIGFYGPLTGATATWGQMGKKAIELAVDEVNADGGLLGKKVKMIYEDDQSLPDQAKLAILKLIKQRKVVAILGEYASSRSLAAAPEAQRHKIPMLSPFSTNPKVTEVGDYIFRACFIDPFQGGAMAKFASHDLHAKNVAILKDVKNDYSIGLADFFRRAFTENGGKIVAELAYSEGDVEFRSQLTAIKATSPDAIFIPGYYTEVGLIARQARELGMNIPLIGGDGWDSPKTVEIGGEAMNNSYYSSHFSADDPSPRAQEFVAKMKDHYGVIPDGTSSTSYEAAKVLFEAIRRAGSTDAEKIRDALAGIKDFEVVTGKFSFDAKRDVIKRVVVMKVQDKQVKFHAIIEPS